MAMSEALKIARLQAHTAEIQALVDLARLIAPVVEILGAKAILDYEVKHQGADNNVAGLVMTSIIAVVGLQAVAPALPALGAAASSTITGVAKAIPAIAAVAAL